MPPPPPLAAKVPRQAETSRLQKLEIAALRALSEEAEEVEDEVPAAGGDNSPAESGHSGTEGAE